ncbi:hypothetical protein BFP70_03370 [Thioclava sp. SK-1]|nr:hypothetical protein BFP70_03370 [Thioclava sp. SK-1]
MRLLQLETEVRRHISASELLHHLANETRAIIEFRQAFAFQYQRSGLRLKAVSSLSSFDRNAPLLQTVTRLVQNTPGDKTVAVELPDHDEQAAFRYGLWVPLMTRKGTIAGGVLFTREKPWPEGQHMLATRLGDVYGHALSALTKDRLRHLPKPIKLMLQILLATVIVMALAFPVPLSAIAPVEIIGRDPAVVAAPLDGVIDEILVTPNEWVEQGTVMARFKDTELRNAADIAQQRVLVNAARLATTSSGAFASADARRDLAVAQAELDLALAEKSLADERLARAQILAPTSGLVILSAAEDWVGRPVSVGERILQIADPARVEYRLSLAVDDLIVMTGDERVRVFLDSDPLALRPAQIHRASFHAISQPDGTLAYELYATDNAQTDDGTGSAIAAGLRIGARGTAQILGEPAPLAFVLLRRPFAWMRQTFGI